MLKYPIIFALLMICLLSSGVTAQTFSAELNGAQQLPANNSPAVGVGSVTLNAAENSVNVTLYFSNLSSAQLTAKIYNANGIVFDLPNGNFSQNFAVSSAQIAELKSGSWFFIVNSDNYPNGEIRGRIKVVSPTNAVSLPFSNGALDTAFDGDGIVTTNINSGTNVAQAVAVQSDGKIVVAGFTFNAANNSDFAVARYNPNGTLDTSFGSGGLAVTPIGTGEDQAYAVAVQPDGKIVAAGHASIGSTIDAAVVRYNSNGTLDTSFSGDGITTTPVGTSNDFLRSVTLQTDGKIVVAGIKYNDSTSDIAVLRFNSDGTLDDTFDGDSGGGNGIVVTVLGTGYSFGYAVTVQPDGKILVAGYYFNGANNNDSAILRYNLNGTLDTSFGSGGLAGTVIGVGTDEAFGVALQADGKIVIAGCVNRGGGNDFLIARYNSNGSPDANFGTNGATITPIGNGVEIANGVAIQSDGKIVAAGFTSNGSNNDFGLVRRNADGTLDTTFDGDGKLVTPIGTGTDSANGLAIQADGKIVVVGRTNVGSLSDFGVVRYGYGTNAQSNDGYFSLSSDTDFRFENVLRPGTTFAESLNSLSIPPLPVNVYLLTAPRFVQTSAAYSGDVIVKFKLPTRVDSANFSAAQILHYENGAWVDRTTGTPPRDFATRTIYARVTKPSLFAIVSPLTPPAQATTLTGRILSANGRGTIGAIVTQTASDGQIRYTVANQFGYYKFPNSSLRQTYTVNVMSKRSRFSPQIITINDENQALNFNGQ